MMAPLSRLGRTARWRDPGLALALCALGELELFGHEQYNGKPVWPGPQWLNAVLIVLLTAPFVWRRSRPLPAFLATFSVLTASTILLGGSEAATTFVVLIAATFSGAAYYRRLPVVLVAAVVPCIAHGFNDPSSEGLADLTWTYGLIAISAIIGRAVWLRQHRIGALENEAVLAAERHARDVADATAAERASIARELHDIVSHAVSVIVIQAQAGSRALSSEPELAADALTAIETSARTAMSELRHLLTLLSAEEQPPTPMVPTASLRQLDELIDQCRQAGLVVQDHIDLGADPVALPPMVDLAAFRVLQEALTNTMRHAPGASTRIVVRHCDDELELVAHDNGIRPEAPSVDGSGRGLIGMRERLALAGGRLLAAEHDGSGFRIHAVIPTRATSEAR